MYNICLALMISPNGFVRQDLEYEVDCCCCVLLKLIILQKLIW